MLNDTDRGNGHTGRKTCHSVTLFTTDSTWNGLESNPVLVWLQLPARATEKRHFGSEVHTLTIKNWVHTSQRTQSVCIIKTSQSILCREITAVCSENHTELQSKMCGWNAEFLGALANLGNAAISFVIVCPYGVTRLPPVWLSWNLIFDCFWNFFYWETWSLMKFDQNNR